MNNRMLIAAFVFSFLILTVSAFAQTPQDELSQMVAQLQKTPGDNALREKIIKLATTLQPSPAIPEEANRAFVKGGVFQNEAKDVSGYDLAISGYREALRVAPWWGDAYFNLGVALTSANKFGEAIASFKLYLASVQPGSAEAREAQNRIYALEAKSEIASKQAAIAAQAQAQSDAVRSAAKASLERYRSGYGSRQVIENSSCGVMSRAWPNNGCDDAEARGNNWFSFSPTGKGWAGHDAQFAFSLEESEQDIVVVMTSSHSSAVYCESYKGFPVRAPQWQSCDDRKKQTPVTITFSRSARGNPLITIINQCDAAKRCRRNAWILQ